MSNINSDGDELSNTNNKPKEHNPDEFIMYTKSKGEDEDKDDMKNTYILVRKLTLRGLRNGIGLVREFWE